MNMYLIHYKVDFTGEVVKTILVFSTKSAQEIYDYYHGLCEAGWETGELESDIDVDIEIPEIQVIE